MQYLIVDTNTCLIDSIINSVFVPTNGDIAGLMARTSLVAYPWFSPAGQQRGLINNAIKLAYNPKKIKEINFILIESTLLSPNPV